MYMYMTVLVLLASTGTPARLIDNINAQPRAQRKRPAGQKVVLGGGGDLSRNFIQNRERFQGTLNKPIKS